MVLRKTEKEGSGLSRPPFAGHHGRVPATPKEMEFHNCVIFFCPSPFPSVPPSSCLRHPPSVILPPSSSLPPCLPPSTHSFTYHNIYIYICLYTWLTWLIIIIIIIIIIILCLSLRSPCGDGVDRQPFWLVRQPRRAFNQTWILAREPRWNLELSAIERIPKANAGK